MNDTTCASGVDLLMDYVEGVVSAGVRTEIEAHVAGCPRCMAFLAYYRETPRILRDATTVDLLPEQQASLRTFLRASRGLPNDN
jgi:anti-sigma factor RsiW